jgi:hypothetical protein
MNETDIQNLLAKEMHSGDFTMKTWCAANGISPQYVVDVMRGRRSPGRKILDILGLEKIILYKRKR